MKIETKFNIGDKVYRLFKSLVESVIACTVCGDTKQVDIKGILFKCPNCDRGTSKWKDRWFVHTDTTTIGQIRTETVLDKCHRSNYFDEDEIAGDGFHTKEQYMLAATGIGSGTLWSHNDLFLTLEEAQAECDKLNSALIEEESKQPL